MMTPQIPEDCRADGFGSWRTLAAIFLGFLATGLRDNGGVLSQWVMEGHCL